MLYWEIVRDVWVSESAAVQAEEARLNKCLRDAEQREQSLIDALVRRAIDDETYAAQAARLGAQKMETRQHLETLTEAEPDVERVLDFATGVLHDLAGYWNQADLPERRVLQEIVYPKGLTFDGERIGTPVSSPVFSYLRGLEAPESTKVALGHLEPMDLLEVTRIGVAV